MEFTASVDSITFLMLIPFYVFFLSLSFLSMQNIPNAHGYISVELVRVCVCMWLYRWTALPLCTTTIFDYIFSDNICLSYIYFFSAINFHCLTTWINARFFSTFYNVYANDINITRAWEPDIRRNVFNKKKNHSLKYVVNIIWKFYSINSRYTWFLSAFETWFFSIVRIRYVSQPFQWYLTKNTIHEKGRKKKGEKQGEEGRR